MAYAYAVGFIGAGAMAKAIVTGMVQKKLFAGSEIIMANRSAQKLDALHGELGIVVAPDNDAVIKEAELIILAIKPQQFPQMMEKLSEQCQPGQTIVSIMAGVTMATIMAVVGERPILRVMPNTPAQIGCGISAISANLNVSAEQLALVERIFASVGETLIVEEHLMDAVGALSGSGPAYLYQVIEALADGGVMAGLPRAMAYKLAAQTMVGAGKMVLETGLHPAELKDQVTSPGGTTIRALAVLEQQGVRGAFIAAVEQAYQQSKKLGEMKK